MKKQLQSFLEHNEMKAFNLDFASGDAKTCNVHTCRYFQEKACIFRALEVSKNALSMR